MELDKTKRESKDLSLVVSNLKVTIQKLTESQENTPQNVIISSTTTSNAQAEIIDDDFESTIMSLESSVRNQMIHLGVVVVNEIKNIFDPTDLISLMTSMDDEDIDDDQYKDTLEYKNSATYQYNYILTSITELISVLNKHVISGVEYQRAIMSALLLPSSMDTTATMSEDMITSTLAKLQDYLNTRDTATFENNFKSICNTSSSYLYSILSFLTNVLDDRRYIQPLEQRCIRSFLRFFYNIILGNENHKNILAYYVFNNSISLSSDLSLDQTTFWSSLLLETSPNCADEAQALCYSLLLSNNKKTNNNDSNLTSIYAWNTDHIQDDDEEDNGNGNGNKKAYKTKSHQGVESLSLSPYRCQLLQSSYGIHTGSSLLFTISIATYLRPLLRIAFISTRVAYNLYEDIISQLPTGIHTADIPSITNCLLNNTITDSILRTISSPSPPSSSSALTSLHLMLVAFVYQKTNVCTIDDDNNKEINNCNNNFQKITMTSLISQFQNTFLSQNSNKAVTKPFNTDGDNSRILKLIKECFNHDVMTEIKSINNIDKSNSTSTTNTNDAANTSNTATQRTVPTKGYRGNTHYTPEILDMDTFDDDFHEMFALHKDASLSWFLPSRENVDINSRNDTDKAHGVDVDVDVGVETDTQGIPSLYRKKPPTIETMSESEYTSWVYQVGLSPTPSVWNSQLFHVLTMLDCNIVDAIVTSSQTCFIAIQQATIILQSFLTLQNLFQSSTIPQKIISKDDLYQLYLTFSNHFEQEYRVKPVTCSLRAARAFVIVISRLSMYLEHTVSSLWTYSQLPPPEDVEDVENVGDVKGVNTQNDENTTAAVNYLKKDETRCIWNKENIISESAEANEKTTVKTKMSRTLHTSVVNVFFNLGSLLYFSNSFVQYHGAILATYPSKVHKLMDITPISSDNSQNMIETGISSVEQKAAKITLDSEEGEPKESKESSTTVTPFVEYSTQEMDRMNERILYFVHPCIHAFSIATSLLAEDEDYVNDQLSFYENTNVIKYNLQNNPTLQHQVSVLHSTDTPVWMKVFLTPIILSLSNQSCTLLYRICSQFDSALFPYIGRSMSQSTKVKDEKAVVHQTTTAITSSDESQFLFQYLGSLENGENGGNGENNNKTTSITTKTSYGSDIASIISTLLVTLLRYLQSCSLYDQSTITGDGKELIEQEAAHEQGKISDDTLHQSTVSNQTKAVNRSPRGFKSDILRTIANITSIGSNVITQSYLGAASGLELCLSQSRMDLHNPLSREWAILATKNLTHLHYMNQSRIASLSVQSVAHNDELKKFGLKTWTQDGKVKIGSDQEKEDQVRQQKIAQLQGQAQGQVDISNSDVSTTNLDTGTVEYVNSVDEMLEDLKDQYTFNIDHDFI